jgi:hypothetical protein
MNAGLSRPLTKVTVVSVIYTPTGKTADKLLCSGRKPGDIALANAGQLHRFI